MVGQVVQPRAVRLHEVRHVALRHARADLHVAVGQRAQHRGAVAERLAIGAAAFLGRDEHVERFVFLEAFEDAPAEFAGPGFLHGQRE
jgi:hypothetical protein